MNKNAALSMTVTSYGTDGSDSEITLVQHMDDGSDDEVTGVWTLDDADLMPFEDEEDTVDLAATADDDGDAYAEILIVAGDDLPNPYRNFRLASDTPIIVIEPTVEDEANLAAETALLGEWIDAYMAGDPLATVYEDWIAKIPPSHSGRFPVTFAA